jgi:syntaxin-binding protein 1
MAFDLLPIKDGEKMTYRVVINEGRPDQEEKDIEIAEKDRIWVENRHRHMKDTLVTFTADFERFMRENKHFANTGQDVNLNQIKDMMAGLSQYQEGKEAYALHLNMAQDAMAIFQKHKLPDLASIEQSLATGLDEDYKKPRNLADQVVRMLDEESIIPPDRLRLIALYMLYKDGLLASDIQLLRQHAQLPPQDEEVLRNLELFGARVTKPLKDPTPPRLPIFPRKPAPSSSTEDDYSLSRFEPNLKLLLEHHLHNTLDPTLFPFIKPDPTQLATLSDPSTLVSSESLRTAKPTWATSKSAPRDDKRQRVIVFVAGGATYSESRACYEVNSAGPRKAEVVLVTSHLLTPGLWMKQVGDLTVERRRLGIPGDGPKRRGPAWIDDERAEAEKGRLAGPGVERKLASPRKEVRNPLSLPTKELGRINLNGNGDGVSSASAAVDLAGRGRLGKERDGKKKHSFFSGKK